jgi:hypothetical protein
MIELLRSVAHGYTELLEMPFEWMTYGFSITLGIISGMVLWNAALIFLDDGE